MSATWTRRPIKTIKPNPNNPRLIKDERFHKLVQSIKDFPAMLELRPIVVNDDHVVLGGNMRLKACIAAGLKDVPVVVASGLSEEQQREFVIKDNVGFGEWEWDALANTWDAAELAEWGLDVPSFADEPAQTTETKNPYTQKISAPIYEITGVKPSFAETYDVTKYEKLCQQIDVSSVSEHEKQLLRVAASRHIVFDYSAMAELYAHSSLDMQELMEESALVIIDFDKAIELGYARITKQLVDEFEEHFDGHA